MDSDLGPTEAPSSQPHAPDEQLFAELGITAQAQDHVEQYVIGQVGLWSMWL